MISSASSELPSTSNMTAIVSPSTPYSTNNMGRFHSRDEDFDLESSFVRHDYFDSSDRDAFPPDPITIQSRNRPAFSDSSLDLKVNDVTPEVTVTAGATRGLETDLKEGITSRVTDHFDSSCGTDHKVEGKSSSSPDASHTTRNSLPDLQEGSRTPIDPHMTQEDSGIMNGEGTNVSDAESESESKSKVQKEGLEDNTMDSHPTSKTRCKRNSRRQRSQKSSTKKWRNLTFEETGFHFSSLALLPDASLSMATSNGDCSDGSLGSQELGDSSPLFSTRNDEIANKDDQTSDSPLANQDDQTPGPSLANEDDQMPGPSLANKDDQTPGPSLANKDDQTPGSPLANKDEEMNDEEFFCALGIDIFDDGDSFDEYDNVLDWDGVHFYQKRQPSLSSLAVKDKTSPKNRPTISPGKDAQSKNNRPHILHHVIKNKYMCNMSLNDVDRLFDFGCVSGHKVYLRPDKDRKGMKTHKAVKSKNAKEEEVRNNPGKKLLYMHHRLVKLLNIATPYTHWCVFSYREGRTPMPKGVDKEWIKGIRLNGQTKKAPRDDWPAGLNSSKPQNLSHVLHKSNSPDDLEMDLASFLMSIQHRELTPEDYDMLLRLDDSVKAKTVGENVLETLRTETVEEGDALELVCAICMESYLVGQMRKYLPCSHDFHQDCIDTWLKNSSQNCPLDGLPIDGSS